MLTGFLFSLNLDSVRVVQFGFILLSTDVSGLVENLYHAKMDSFFYGVVISFCIPFFFLNCFECCLDVVPLSLILHVFFTYTFFDPSRIFLVQPCGVVTFPSFP